MVSLSSLLSLLRLWKEKDGGYRDRPTVPQLSGDLSLTSPSDCCRAAAVSTLPDAVWDRFLPQDIDVILSRAVEPVDPTLRTGLYLRLCRRPILVRGDGDGKMEFSLERSSGKKCYAIGARNFYIPHNECPENWKWISHPDFRFGEVVELLEVWWLEVQCEISCSLLSPRTNYAAYLIFKLVENATEGLAFPSQRTSVVLGTHESSHAVCLDVAEGEVASDVLRTPCERIDAWKEIEMGDFFTDESDERKVLLTFKQTLTMNRKRGLIIDAIEVRPKLPMETV